ncbi:MAG TPA: hypothetical protein VEY71_00805 [Chitinophagales bacterium]|nr:hypothetical protein [Chitinophagales bacterium]
MNIFKPTLALLALLITGNSAFAQSTDNWGIGLRLGDPSGLTVKRYFGMQALELNVGRTHMWNRRGWYDNRFDNWYDGKDYNYSEFRYVGYKASAPISVQLHMLFHNKIGNKGSEDLSGMQWYYGVGGQVRTQRYYYDYQYKMDGNNGWHDGRGEYVTDLDLGVDGVLGLEYKFKKAPVALFTDATLFMEVADDPFVFWMQGGLGVRYNF